MTMLEETRRRRRNGPSMRDRIGRIVLVAVCLALAFLLGVAFARTVDDRPASGDAVTDVRTLTPLPQGPPTRTVTVTVTTP